MRIDVNQFDLRCLLMSCRRLRLHTVSCVTVLFNLFDTIYDENGQTRSIVDESYEQNR
jgi:hypothetical protein